MAGLTPPEWFTRNISAPCESRFVDVDGCPIHYLLWRGRRSSSSSSGKVGTDPHRRAGLVFVHGNLAHAHWFAFLAPFFLDDYDVVSLSNSGNGQSGWRQEYSFDAWGAEVIGVAADAGFLDPHSTRARPVVCAHSLGTCVAIAAAANDGDKLGGIILLDEIPRPPGYFDGMPPPSWVKFDQRTGKRLPGRAKVRAAEVLPRDCLKLAPPQKPMNRYIRNYIADHSVRRVGAGWTWAFDPAKDARYKPGDEFPATFDRFLTPQAVQSLQVRVAFVVGERSAVCTPQVVNYNRRVIGDEIPITVIKDAAHHIMIDQPLALVAALDSTLAEWKRSSVSIPIFPGAAAGQEASRLASSSPSSLVLPRLEQRVMQSTFDLERDLPGLKWSSNENMTRQFGGTNKKGSKDAAKQEGSPPPAASVADVTAAPAAAHSRL